MIGHETGPVAARSGIDARPLRVLVAGGGIAALETVLALRAFAGELVEVRVLAPSSTFELVPQSVLEPFGARRAPRHLPSLFRAAGAELVQGTLGWVESGVCEAITVEGRRLSYDRLVLAVGARREPSLAPPALTFGGPADVPAFRRMLDKVTLGGMRGVRTRLVVVVPPGPGWPLPAYELALLTADHLERHGAREAVEIRLLTHEDAPLALFGPRIGEAVTADLGAAGIELRRGTVVRDWAWGQLELLPHGAVSADQVVALPLLRGPSTPGLPHDRQGFIRADREGRIHGLADAFVVGDAGPFPIKQGGVGCQQADGVAARIASEAGAPIEPEPVDPALVGLMVAGGDERSLRARPTASGEEALGETWRYRLVWPAGKVAGRFLVPFLEGRPADALRADGGDRAC